MLVIILIFIGIVLIGLILLFCLACVMDKVWAVAKVNPKKTKYIISILFIILIITGGFGIKKLFYERSPYHFWYDILKKNSIPFNISQEEFEKKNREGYCWRDRRYYTKKELWHKAMKSLTERMIFENSLFWNDDVLDDNRMKSWTSGDCKRWNSCRVWRIPLNLNNQELKKHIEVEEGENYMEKIEELINTDKAQSYVTLDQNFINDDFKLENFILIQNNSGAEIYGNNCCSILSKSEWSIISKNYILNSTKSDIGTFVEEAKIPEKININSWGVGNFYLSTNYFNAGDKETLNNVFYLNNCGDVLYKPFYFKKLNLFKINYINDTDSR